MIVCQCNVLTEQQILAALSENAGSMPRSPVQVFRCLGCKPMCGRCVPQIRELLKTAGLDACAVGCASCPASEQAVANDAGVPTVQRTEPNRVWLRAAGA